jgi:FlaG/FlaF family flagellin (archaellin)
MHPNTPSGRAGLDGDERGVTPVISVVLVVALTMVVAALVGANALAVADHSAHAAPSVGFHTHWEGGDTLVVEHQSGSAVETARIAVFVDGAEVYDGGDLAGDGVTVSGWDGDEIHAGDTATITSASGFAGESFAVYYEWDGKSFVLVED